MLLLQDVGLLALVKAHFLLLAFGGNQMGLFVLKYKLCLLLLSRNLLNLISVHFFKRIRAILLRELGISENFTGHLVRQLGVY
jgi:hypothetical protein